MSVRGIRGVCVGSLLGAGIWALVIWLIRWGLS
jgi:hypothetical protein